MTLFEKLCQTGSCFFSLLLLVLCVVVLCACTTAHLPTPTRATGSPPAKPSLPSLWENAQGGFCLDQTDSEKLGLYLLTLEGS